MRSEELEIAGDLDSPGCERGAGTLDLLRRDLLLDSLQRTVQSALKAHRDEPHVCGDHRIGHGLRHDVTADVEVEKQIAVAESGNPMEQVESPSRAGIELLAPEAHLPYAAVVEKADLLDDVAGRTGAIGRPAEDLPDGLRAERAAKRASPG